MDPIADLQHNVPLAPLTTFGIGGEARFFLTAETEDSVRAGLEYARREGIDLFVLGGGSNILVADSGFDGLVLQVDIRGLDEAYDAATGKVRLTVGAGEDWDSFVGYCVRNGFAGLECLSGIPGLVGGTPVQNVGAYGQEVAETIRGVRCIDRSTGYLVELTNDDCGFSYRTSIFNSTERDRYVVVSVTFELTANGGPKVIYRDLVDHFAGRLPRLSDVREAVLEIRRSKSMVIDAADPNTRCAGSFFKNPVIDSDKLSALTARWGDIPHFAFDGGVKIPAAWLIGKAGFPKGYVMGAAGISTNHNLALINRGNARAADIFGLQQAIIAAVQDRFGITLVPEPVFVGF